MPRRMLMSGGGASASTPPDPTDPVDPDPWWLSPANIVVDGNSIYADFYTTVGAFSNHIMLEEPFASGPFTHVDVAVNGQRWWQMVDDAADVDAAYVDGVTNVLVAAETTNEIYFGNASFATCITDITNYLTRVRSTHPDWLILLVGSIPAANWGIEDVAVRNDRMIAVDEHLAANFAAMGADGYIGYRDLPPFVGNGVTTPYDEFAECWHDEVHPADPGKVYMRQRVVEGLLALPAEH